MRYGPVPTGLASPIRKQKEPERESSGPFEVNRELKIVAERPEEGSRGHSAHGITNEKEAHRVSDA